MVTVGMVPGREEENSVVRIINLLKSTGIKTCALMEEMMHKYVIFIKNNESKVIQKESITRSFIKEMKQKGFREHHVEVEAENEKEAINKLNENSEDYLNSLSEFSGSIFIIASCVVIMILVYFLFNKLF